MADSADPFPSLASVYKGPSCQVNQPSQNVADIKLGSEKDIDHNVSSLGPMNRVVSKTWFSKNSIASIRGDPPKGMQILGVKGKCGSGLTVGNALPIQPAEGDPKGMQILGVKGKCESGLAIGNALPIQTADPWGSKGTRSACSQPVSEHGLQCFSQSGPSQSDNLQGVCIKTESKVGNVFDDENEVADYDDDDDSDVVYDSDDLDEYDYDSDASHEDRKRSKWFRKFFESFDKLTIEELKSPERQWHCPACQGGPGAIDWYRGLEPILIHAKTKKARRARLHREFATLLDEELRKRGTSITALGEVFGKWEGLNERVKDYEIVWPPMVIIMNTRYEYDENGKWIGMGNQELLDHFSSYAAIKARHSYGPKGHRGMSVLIFESSVAGYLEAVRLHKHFKEQGKDRDAWDQANKQKERASWDSSRVPLCPGGKRQLYGYLALKEDLDIFNQHNQGKSKLKYEMTSYLETVEKQITQINYDSQQVTQLKEKMGREQRQSQALAESLGRVSEKLRQTTKENHILKQRTKLQHEQNKEEMDAQEEFFKEQINIIYRTLDTKEDNFEKLWKAAQEKVEKSNANASVMEVENRTEETTRFITFQDEKMEEFEAERQKLMKIHQEKKSEIMQRYWGELLELEKQLEQEATMLMEKYTPQRFGEKTN
ncbi:hypothetical protein SLA2020_028580 [Shorea laevis]